MAPKDISDLHTELYINGKWTPSSDGSKLDVIDPSTEDVIASVDLATKEDAEKAVDAAHKAFQSWRETAPRERAEILRKTFDLMVKRKDDIASLIVQENGKAYRDAMAETMYAAEFFRWYSEEAVRNIEDLYDSPSGQYKIMVRSHPVGVSLLITPWNFPAAMATRKIGPALAAGCTVILKPASETPLTALLIAEILEEAGVPEGVVNVLCAKGSSGVMDHIMEDPRVRKVSFTGSTEVGRMLLAKAAESVMNTSMELGGNAPFVVFAAATLAAAVEGAMVAKMRNGGEACTAANRFIVEESVADEFGKKFAEAMKKLKVGPGLEDGVELGPMVNKEAIESIQELVKDAVDKGAHLLTGGEAMDKKGYYYPPTVISGVKPGARMLKEEIFGPVAPITAFKSEDEAIALANDTEYGLISYVFTEDLKKGLRVSEKIESGMVGLNRGVVSDPAAPFGGMKQSGIGREGAHDGMLEFMEKQYISVIW